MLRTFENCKKVRLRVLNMIDNKKNKLNSKFKFKIQVQSSSSKFELNILIQTIKSVASRFKILIQNSHKRFKL